MSDILSIRVGEVWRGAGMVARADGSAITTGTVTYYLKALTGDNVGKWWKNDDQTWAVAETGTEMTHQADGRWTVQLTESPFEVGIVYEEYVKESNDLHVPAEGRELRGVLGYELQAPDTGATAVSRYDGSDTPGTETLLTEVAKIPRQGYLVTGENVTVDGDYTGETETVKYVTVEAAP